ncbi:MAG TPA: UDP-N-acetylmuramoyl-tripeptide--D-alanyl-D-alanine ligase [Candidatus Paceibacterota bacterium]
MKYRLIKTLQYILRLLAVFIIWRHRPGIIGITGSVGKTSTKQATAAVLAVDRKIRYAPSSHNNEIGFPLAVIGEWSKKDLKLVSNTEPPGIKKILKFFFWLKVFTTGIFALFGSKSKYPELLILEYGIQEPGDMKKLLNIAKPNIGIITAIGEIPVHVEFFTGVDALAREKSRLVEFLPAAGFAVLNYDDDTVMRMKDRTRARTISYGFGEGADVRITNFENRSEGSRPAGIAFKLEYAGSFVPVRLDEVFGKAQAYAAAAAAAAGLIFGINLIKIAESLKKYRPIEGRMTLIEGIKETLIIDDSYNAAPLSMHAALDTLRLLKAKRKVAVLGDMLEIGKFTLEAHEEMGRIAAKTVNVLVTVGGRAKFIAETARKSGMQKRNIFSFETAEEAKMPVQDLLKKGDLVLVKASHAMGFQDIVEEIRLPKEMAHAKNQI